ncbi:MULTISPECIES: NADH-quinone oxidoreductase subunit L [Flavobacteriaceae]|uniref:NADH-quinone oxidoreductase subunit L n=2 Tax=Flavobacteriaceae TaxID=49546 RepID=A0A4Y8ATZ9_9FLAO|nr:MULTISPECIES: NADH-quinone oxidoreductase subunit L [Flavobacteriaceae]TEW74846.1 NADH-quinone oxidoreductase subunit L [Gramella jeungdoensis]GGK43547.1 NADH dehydrogenase subunit L [Lutibacter litoralis]
MNFTYVILIPLIPLLSFLVLGIFNKKIKPSVSGYLGVAALSTSTALSFYTAYQYFFAIGKVNGVYQTFVEKTTWMNFTDTLAIDMGILIDPISVMMLIVVSVISLMVHIYSRGYMKGDDGYTRFFAFLGLFSFSMFGLVLATNLFQIYIFWELVGVSSFLLIGYYYTKPSAVSAAKKAFIVTRFADLGFLVGILIIGYYTGTFDFETLNNPEGSAILNWASTSFIGLSVITWALILIFIGGAGKSAMFPLHIWLPDAMEGPTPVSALIHAATMVVAGVYLVARLFPMYYFVEDGFALNIVAYVGAFSSLFAAIIAITQTDIKRVLAFSTMSQLGYMMLALGVSGYDGHEGVGYMASMFHLFTHAMFKALLFLGAGSVIHAVHSNYLKDMGGLRKYMPITNITFLIAALAISGVFPLSGFWSKDEILVAAFEHNKLIYGVGVFVAGLTAFYMFRLYFGIFWGKDKQYKHAPHESPISMTFPLMILAFISMVGGFIPFSELITPDKAGFEAHLNIPLAIVATIVGLTGIGLAYVFYKKENDLADRFSNAFGVFYKWTFNKFYFDEIYLFVTKNIIFNRIAAPIAWFDKKVVDGTMEGIGNKTVVISEKIKGIQSGKVQDYAFGFIAGVVILALVFIYLWTN